MTNSQAASDVIIRYLRKHEQSQVPQLLDDAIKAGIDESVARQIIQDMIEKGRLRVGRKFGLALKES